MHSTPEFQAPGYQTVTGNMIQGTEPGLRVKGTKYKNIKKEKEYML